MGDRVPVELGGLKLAMRPNRSAARIWLSSAYVGSISYFDLKKSDSWRSG
jgi:hypothetical protein